MNPSYHPDGLTEALIDDLIAEVFAEVKPRIQPVRSQSDDTNELRRIRRLKNRAAARLARQLPFTPDVADEGEAA